jgi:hypothetical protein
MMIDFDSYLPKYKERIKRYYDIQGSDCGKNYLRMVNVSSFGETYFAYEIEDPEKEPFAGILFTTNLLAQVIFTYGKRFSKTGVSDRNFYLQHTEEKSLLFPEIEGGLLSGAYFHICPSVLPLMIFYMDSSKKLKSSWHHQDSFAAKIEWTKHRSLFEDSVNWILRDLHRNMKILCNVDITPEEQVEIRKLMWFEFSRIDKELRPLPKINK